MKPALLVIDMQAKFFKRGQTTQTSLEKAVEYINAAIALFRKKGLPVIVVEHVDEGSGLVPGSEGFKTHESIALLPSDPRIRKKSGDAFHSTDLMETLESLSADGVIITGFCAEYCVLSTIKGAENRNIPYAVLSGSLASGDLSNITFVEKISESVSYGALSYFLE